MATDVQVVRLYQSKLKTIKMKDNLRGTADQNGVLAKQDVSAEAVANTIALTYRDWVSDAGETGINPRAILIVESNSIQFLLEMDVVMTVDGLEWKIDHSGIQVPFHDGIAQAFHVACKRWVRREFGATFTIRMDGSISESKQR